MVPREIVKVIEGVLSETEEVLSLLLLERVGLYRDAEGKDRTTCLYRGYITG